jgi:acyl-CoA synthetase (AMP-forming)/AMP-acid ligase II
MNIILLYTFGITLFQPPAMIYRFAILADKSIPKSLGEKKIAAYCYKVTVIWVVFFIINGSIAALTVFYGSDLIWAIYNNVAAPVLIGILFAGEFIVRKFVQKKIPKAVPLSSFNKKSRNLTDVMCYEGIWSDGIYKTWGDFLKGTSVLRKKIESAGGDRWFLYCEDCWHFLLAFTALLQCKKEIILSSNISPGYITEIKGDANLLTDHIFPIDGIFEKTLHISSILSENAQEGNYKCPKIISDETSIVLFTSGSTVTPKAIIQRLTELENDNAFILSMWAEELLIRKVCSTVSQHHIYGLLFSILLPFTAGIPFRRQRIQIPEEFIKLIDTEYTIITIPAFLKRGVEILTPNDLSAKSPWIFVSGGVLDPELAKKTGEIFGFWPLEIYGSTETSGIAWRQSDKGIEWTPFDNVQLGQNDKGCLVICSPYIKDTAGFETADTVELLDDGRFSLKERIDSVVKIEEKRISLVEMETRILQSGLVCDAFVVPMESKRQYLAAVIVFNNKGKEKFNNIEIHNINKFWREYLLKFFENVVIPKKWRYPEVLPADTQGKVKRNEIMQLFFQGNQTINNDFVKYNKTKLIEKNEKSVTLEISIPDTSPYFDGHFPGFPVLPAVAQVDLVVHFASEYFGIRISVSKINRIKFLNIIRPGDPLVLFIETDKKNIVFKISSPGSETVYSSGVISVCL